MKKLSWTDFEDLGIALYEARPTVDPLTVRFTDLHQWIIELDDFEDDASKSNEAKLEAIQMAWYEEWKDNANQ
jgi:FeS assembly protein IscX